MKLTTSLSSAALSAARLAATLCAAVCLSSCFHAADDVAEETLPTKAFTFNVKREDGTVITAFDLPDVTLKKNRITQLTGEVFNRTGGFSVSIDDAWDSPLEVTF